MPELPEVQTVVDFLKDRLPGKTIQSVQSPNGYKGVFENGSLAYYQAFLCERQIQSIWRRGKFIIMELDSGFLLFHLRMTGRFILDLPNKSEFKYISFQLIFSDGFNLFFRDTRKFGRAYICQKLDWLEDRLGIEPLSNDLTPSWLYQQLKQRKRMIKPLLMDQRFIAGLGNIYVDEVLWQAKIHPKAISITIGKVRCIKLCIAIKDVLKNAIKYKGTTIIDFRYGSNEKGRFKKELKVFGKIKKPCTRCSKPIDKIFVSQRGTYYCKKCQRI